MSNRNIPGNVLRQFALQSQKQSVGQLGASPEALPRGTDEKGRIDLWPPKNVVFNTFTYQTNFTLPYNDKRIYLLIQNQGNQILVLDFQGSAGVVLKGLKLAAEVAGGDGGFYEPFLVPKNQITGNMIAPVIPPPIPVFVGFVIEGIIQ